MLDAKRCAAPERRTLDAGTARRSGRGLGKEILPSGGPVLPCSLRLPSTVTVARVFGSELQLEPTWYPPKRTREMPAPRGGSSISRRLCAHGTRLLLPGVSVASGDDLDGMDCP